jgi:cellulose biosynthesis protein BcsQ
VATHLAGLDATLPPAYPLRPGKKRLLIDMDYQATLSYILTTACDITERESRSQALLAQGATEATLFRERLGLDAVLPGCELVPAFYALGRHEDRLMMEWLLGDVNDDLRYRLASLLYRPDVASQYDMVIIDAPPRLTTGTVNGLCACTHLIVPTAFTAASAEPVANFLAMAKAMKLKFNPNLKLVGVVETLTPAGNVGQAARQARELARITVQRALRTHFPDALILERDIPRNNALAEEGIPYNDNQTVRGIIEQLGAQVREELT